MPGYVSASTCDLTNGNPVVSVLSSPNPTGGPWTCLDIGPGQDSDPACTSNVDSIDAFTYVAAYPANTYLFFAVGLYKVATPSPYFALRVAQLPGPRGTWDSPLPLPDRPTTAEPFVGGELLSASYQLFRYTPTISPALTSPQGCGTLNVNRAVWYRCGRVDDAVGAASAWADPDWSRPHLLQAAVPAAGHFAMWPTGLRPSSLPFSRACSWYSGTDGKVDSIRFSSCGSSTGNSAVTLYKAGVRGRVSPADLYPAGLVCLGCVQLAAGRQGGMGWDGLRMGSAADPSHNHSYCVGGLQGIVRRRTLRRQ